MLTLKLKEITGPLPTSIYEIIVDGVVVGICQLRHRPSKSLTMPEGFESHAWYEIESEFRNKGYATEALKELLIEAKNIELKEIILTIAEDNIYSQRVVEKNGGLLLETKPDQNGILYRKYLISL